MRAVKGIHPITWRIGDKLTKPQFPMVMGIINATPDSFLEASRVMDVEAANASCASMLAHGASIIDIGGASSRPGSDPPSEKEELERVIPLIEGLISGFPNVLLSIDTWRATVAKAAVEAGARIVNDISAGMMDEQMFSTVAQLNVPYVLMHMQGTPATMQQDPKYVDVVAEVLLFLSERLNAAHAAGIADVIIDPGLGFGKRTEHNYALLKELQRFQVLQTPVLLGVSRKRMINDVLGTAPAEALNGTTSANTIALLNGASILRVHDVKEAVQAIRIYEATYASDGTAI